MVVPYEGINILVSKFRTFELGQGESVVAV